MHNIANKNFKSIIVSLTHIKGEICLKPYNSFDKLGLIIRISKCVAEIFNNIIKIRPIILFIDNFQWSDNCSTCFILKLFKHMKKRGIMLLLNVRTSENSENQQGKKIQKYKKKDVVTQIISLKTFNKEEARELSKTFLRDHFSINHMINESIEIPHFISVLSVFATFYESAKNPFLLKYINLILSHLPDDARKILEFACTTDKPICFYTTLNTLKMCKNRVLLIRILIKKRLLKQVIINKIFFFQTYNEVIRNVILGTMNNQK